MPYYTVPTQNHHRIELCRNDRTPRDADHITELAADAQALIRAALDSAYDLGGEIFEIFRDRVEKLANLFEQGEVLTDQARDLLVEIELEAIDAVDGYGPHPELERFAQQIHDGLDTVHRVRDLITAEAAVARLRKSIGLLNT